MRALGFIVGIALGLALPVQAQAQMLRPQVGKPLQQASELLGAGKAREALAKVSEAETVKGKTADELLTIARMKGAAAQRAGDYAIAIDAFESVFGKVDAAEQRQIAEALAHAHAQLRQWPQAQQWIDKARHLGADPVALRELQSYVQSQTGDYAAIARASAAAVTVAEKAGKRPGEDELLRLADAQQRMGEPDAYLDTLGKLLSNYPKPDYWRAYLERLPRKTGFSDRYRLDVLRLRLASGTLDEADDFMALAQLALQARLPDEAQKVIDQGFADGVLGQGADAARHQRLRDLAVKDRLARKAGIDAEIAPAEMAPNGNLLVEVGYAVVTMGDVERGISLIERGIAKGGLKRPQEAGLRLGMAQLQSSASKANGVRTLRDVHGNDGVADIARLWTLLARKEGS